MGRDYVGRRVNEKKRKRERKRGRESDRGMDIVRKEEMDDWGFKFDTWYVRGCWQNRTSGWINTKEPAVIRLCGVSVFENFLSPFGHIRLQYERGRAPSLLCKLNCHEVARWDSFLDFAENTSFLLAHCGFPCG